MNKSCDINYDTVKIVSYVISIMKVMRTLNLMLSKTPKRIREHLHNLNYNMTTAVTLS